MIGARGSPGRDEQGRHSPLDEADNIIISVDDPDTLLDVGEPLDRTTLEDSKFGRGLPHVLSWLTTSSGAKERCKAEDGSLSDRGGRSTGQGGGATESFKAIGKT
jgi:hypothetical protein